MNYKKCLSSNSSSEFSFFARRSPVVALSSAGELHDSSQWSVTLREKIVVDNSLQCRQCESQCKPPLSIQYNKSRFYAEVHHCQGCKPRPHARRIQHNTYPLNARRIQHNHTLWKRDTAPQNVVFCNP